MRNFSPSDMIKLFLGNTCKTVSGPSANKPCQFPFVHNQKTYYECTTDDHNQPWCKTGTTGTWGNCGSSCKKHISGIYFTFKD